MFLLYLFPHESKEHLLSLPSYFNYYFNSDSGWYEKIYLYGYEHIPESVSQNWQTPLAHYAFFPLYPMLIRSVHLLLGTNFVLSGFILNILTLLFLCRQILVYLTSHGYSAHQAVRMGLIWLFLPFSLHFYFIYTEALFALLLLSVFHYISLFDYWKASLAAALLVMCRPNGIALALPIFILLGMQTHQKKLFNPLRYLSKAYLVLWVMTFTFIGLLLWQWNLCGNAFAFAEAQKAWNKQGMFPLMALFRHGFAVDVFQSIFIVILMLLLVFFYKKWKLHEHVLIWMTFILPMAAGSVISLSRYVSVLFQIPFALTSNMSQKSFRIIMAIFIIFQMFLLNEWLHDSPIMY